MAATMLGAPVDSKSLDCEAPAAPVDTLLESPSSRSDCWRRVGRPAVVLLACAGVSMAAAHTLFGQRRLSSSSSLEEEAEAASFAAALAEANQRSLSAASATSEAEGGCHDAIPFEDCYYKTVWAQQTGIHMMPGNYPGLNPGSSFKEFQAYLHQINYGGCPMPCGMAQQPPSRPQNTGDPNRDLNPQGIENCLCIFDIDRTLTAKQGFHAQCQGSELHAQVFDAAYTGGDLVLSPLGVHLQETWCGRCHQGVVSAGTAGSPEMKSVLLQKLTNVHSDHWSPFNAVQSPLVLSCPNELKPNCAKNIVDWYISARGITVPPQEVYFFDDHNGNTNGFDRFGYNARQVSCPTRDGPVGLCGAEVWELVREKGTHNCR